MPKSEPMGPIAMLRLATSEEHHDEVLSLLPASRIDKAWRKGERRNAREVHNDYGANVFLAEEATAGETLKKALQILARQSELLRAVQKLDTRMELDLGFEPALSEQTYSTSVALEPKDAGLLGEFGVVLKLTVYRDPQ